MRDKGDSYNYRLSVEAILMSRFMRRCVLLLGVAFVRTLIGVRHMYVKGLRWRKRRQEDDET